ncbi:TMEM175 family protein [Caballeronia sp. GAWG2-1]|uniref:TMEM175 family protein n=1 Tax=Caballeronia sp. GAWG2-1 TaxID=2921744 RepID=UPI002027F306|nr:TMEM175 family protein [Caballeronia sp. GAWG2-1]
MLRKRPADVETHGAERGLDRFGGFSDAVFAIALTLLIVEIKVPGSPEGTHGYSDLASAMRSSGANSIPWPERTIATE